MPASAFTVADVMDRGLAAVPDALVRLDESEVAAKLDVTALVRESFAGARDAADLGALIGPIVATVDPLVMATALIASRYAALGGASGPLGPTTGAVGGCPDGFGFYRHFRAGSIYWHPVTGVHEVHGAIRAKWAALGWERSFLGYPTSDQLPGTDPEQRGVFNRFQGGAIHWHPEAGASRETLVGALSEATFVLERTPMTTVNATGKMADRLMARVASIGDVAAVTVLGDPEMVLGSAKGAYEVHGRIGVHYRSLGGSGSFLGYPITDECTTPDGVGRYNHFQAGSIYWSPSTGAHEVHGLIRGLWAQGGWERNAALGYPITDELIPDRRVGHRRPETRRKPIGLPADVIKLPAEAILSGFSPLISNVSARDLVRNVRGTPGNGAAGHRLHLETVAEVASVGVFHPGSTPAPEPSLNRYGDFESGVVFWRRGASAARQIQPWEQTSGGTSMRRSPSEVIAAMEPSLRQALSGLSGASVAGFSFGGTTGYTFDGASVHNRRQRVFAQLQTTQQLPVPFGPWVPVPVTVAVELRIEVAFEPFERRVTVCLADWSFAPPVLVAASPPLDRQLHQKLDGLMFKPVELLGIPDTDEGQAIAVLSVKTMPDGSVCLFVEPAPERGLVDGIRESVHDVIATPATGRFRPDVRTPVDIDR